MFGAEAFWKRGNERIGRRYKEPGQPGGGIAPDGTRWISCRPGFFLPVRVLGRLFRGKFLAFLHEAFERGELAFHGDHSQLAEPVAFQGWLQGLRKVNWIVYAKPPFGGPEQVLKYLARYTHRVAISNQRLVKLEDGRVTVSFNAFYLNCSGSAEATIRVRSRNSDRILCILRSTT